jgi:small subunit ribosomal protein S8
MVTDPIADMLTRIRNAMMARQAFTLIPSSRIKVELARVLKDEGYIENFELSRDELRPQLRVYLRYAEGRKPVITSLERVSKPGRRVYVNRRAIPWVLSGLGIAILSTPRGIMSDQKARHLGVGGEVLCYIW